MPTADRNAALATTLAKAAHEAVIDYYDDDFVIQTKDQRRETAMTLLRVVAAATGLPLSEVAQAAKTMTLAEFTAYLGLDA